MSELEDKSSIRYNVPYLFTNDAPIEEPDIPFEEDWDDEDEFDESPDDVIDIDEYEEEIPDDQKKTWKELSKVSKKQAKKLSSVWEKSVNAK